MAKYAKRGFKVAVPGFKKSMIDHTIFRRATRDLCGLARLLRLEMLDVMKVPLKAHDELGVMMLDSIGNESSSLFGTVVQNKGSNTRIFEALSEALIHESDYSSTYFPSGPGWHGFDILDKILTTGLTVRNNEDAFHHTREGRVNDNRKKNSTSYDSVGINQIGSTMRHGSPKWNILPECADFVGNEICGHLKFCLANSYQKFNQGAKTGSTELVVESRLKWIIENPGRQYVTGSFHPLRYDWFAQALDANDYFPTVKRIETDIKICERKIDQLDFEVDGGWMDDQGKEKLMADKNDEIAKRKAIFEAKIVELKSMLDIAVAKDTSY